MSIDLLVEKRIDEKGKVEIPQEILEAADLLCGEKLSFEYIESEDIIIVKPVSKRCKICEDEEGTIAIDEEENIYICESCQAKVIRAAE